MANTFSSLDDLVDFINHYVPKAPRNFVLFQLNRAIGDFLERSRAWEHSFDITFEADTYTYELSGIAYDARIQHIRNIKYGTDSIAFSLFSISSGASGPDRYLTFDSDWTDGMEGLDVTCNVDLALNSFDQGLPSDLMIRYGNSIVMGAVYYLAGIPRRPYTDIDLSKYALAEFENGIGTALRDKNENKTDVAVRLGF